MTAVRDRVSGVRFQDVAREKAMKKAFVGLTFSAVLLALCLPAEAQQPAKVPRIGVLGSVPFDQVSDRVAAFRQGLRELGYVEGKNIVIEWRSSDGNLDRNAALAAELLRLKVDVIVSLGSSLTRAAKAATSTVPIVMTQEPDPVGNGFVASLARPQAAT
jgi:putative tryptophan/tyrosine transport system substrate-binding protein